MLLRARTVLPIAAPPIDDGGVLVRGERIEKVGRWSDLVGDHPGPVFDLGDVILLPGLINAHCHLDYTDMAGQLAPARHFSDWIKSIVTLKASWSFTDFALSWLNGAKMLLHSGTTTVVDIEAVPELLPEAATASPLRVVSCLELLSVRSRSRPEEMISEAMQRLQRFPEGFGGLSPHAPYSTSGELLRLSAAAARENDWLLTTHVAESADEFEMFRTARGAMYEWLHHQRDMSDCDGRSPVEHLDRCGVLGANLLAVHANYLAEGDAALLARHAASVVHCPRSHHYFGHMDFPLEKLSRAGVNICLGTDSMATMAKLRGEPLALDLFSEMRTFARAHAGIPPASILEMVTVQAARAIRQTGELGVLAAGAEADLIVIPRLDGEADPCLSVLEHRGDVAASMIGGRWVLGRYRA
jgi:cytosine/adenosine deaminase-related metal-dependent hydrolase